MLAVPTSSAPRLSIVIVTARQPARLLRCLRAVQATLPAELACEVVVVLNAAEPALREALEREVAGLRIVESDVPLGFAGGSNLGAAHARGSLIHVLHDDTEVQRDWLPPLLRLLAARPEIGAVGSAILDFGGGLQTAGHVLWRDGVTTPRWLEAPPPAEELGDAYPVDYCGSASLLVRREAWDAVGGFDADFHPAYYVDVDFAMALRAAGYVVMCEAASRVEHERGGTSGAAFREFLTARHRERLLEKWARDLQHQEPRADGPAALERARHATERRAAAVAAGPRTAAARPADRAEDELARLRRDRVALQREAAVHRAFTAHAEALLAEAQTTRAALEAEATAAHRAVREHVAAQAELQARLAEREALAARLPAAEAELAVLRPKAETLAAIEAGGWWRLRNRLVPLLRLAASTRRGLRRGRG